ncbi:MAG: hypothetical protein QXW47_08225 [Candidatus Jordarchaeales archaeon]
MKVKWSDHPIALPLREYPLRRNEEYGQIMDAVSTKTKPTNNTRYQA